MFIRVAESFSPVNDEEGSKGIVSSFPAWLVPRPWDVLMQSLVENPALYLKGNTVR